MNKTHKNKNNPEKKRIKITKKPRRRLVWCMKIVIFLKPKLLDDYLGMGGEEEEQNWSSGDD